jgi:hypothetical protein
LIKFNVTKKKLDSARRSRVAHQKQSGDNQSFDSENQAASQIEKDALNLDHILSRVDSKGIDAPQLQNAAQVPALNKALAKITESAPQLESKNLKEAKAADNQLTSSSNSLKPVMRSQLFRK